MTAHHDILLGLVATWLALVAGALIPMRSVRLRPTLHAIVHMGNGFSFCTVRTFVTYRTRIGVSIANDKKVGMDEADSLFDPE